MDVYTTDKTAWLKCCCGFARPHLKEGDLWVEMSNPHGGGGSSDEEGDGDGDEAGPMPAPSRCRHTASPAPPPPTWVLTTDQTTGEAWEWWSAAAAGGRGGYIKYDLYDARELERAFLDKETRLEVCFGAVRFDGAPCGASAVPCGAVGLHSGPRLTAVV